MAGLLDSCVSELESLRILWKCPAPFDSGEGILISENLFYKRIWQETDCSKHSHIEVESLH